MAKKRGFVLLFEDDPDLFDAINRYRKSLGWTWRRLFIMGFLYVLEKNKDNPDLIMRLIEYMEDRR